MPHHVQLLAVDNYPASTGFSVLRRPVADARAVAAALATHVGYESLPALVDEQCTRAAIIERIEALRDLDVGDRVVVYVAGHGESIAHRGYLIPWDGRPDEPSSWIPFDEIIDALRDGRPSTSLILVDVCDAGYVLQRRMTDAGFAGSGKTVYAIASCYAGREAADESPFARFIVEALEGWGGLGSDEAPHLVAAPDIARYVVRRYGETASLHRQGPIAGYLARDPRTGSDFELVPARPRLAPSVVHSVLHSGSNLAALLEMSRVLRYLGRVVALDFEYVPPDELRDVGKRMARQERVRVWDALGDELKVVDAANRLVGQPHIAWSPIDGESAEELRTLAVELVVRAAWKHDRTERLDSYAAPLRALLGGIIFALDRIEGAAPVAQTLGLIENLEGGILYYLNVMAVLFDTDELESRPWLRYLTSRSPFMVR